MLTFSNIFNNSLIHFSLFRFIIIITVTFFLLLAFNAFCRIFLRKYLNTYALIVLFDFLCYLTFIFEVGLFSRTSGQPSNVYLVPFRFLFFEHGVSQIRLIIFALLNIIYFIPYGIVTGMITSNIKSLLSIYLSICISFITSFILEFSQYISKRGHFETEDIILNTTGGLIGCSVFIMIHLIYTHVYHHK